MFLSQLYNIIHYVHLNSHFLRHGTVCYCFFCGQLPQGCMSVTPSSNQTTGAASILKRSTWSPQSLRSNPLVCYCQRQNLKVLILHRPNFSQKIIWWRSWSRFYVWLVSKVLWSPQKCLNSFVLFMKELPV